jgi:hypothetical protein
MYTRALDIGRRLINTPVVFLALTGLAVLDRHHGRNDAAVAAATEALEVYLAGGPRRLANRIDPRADVLAGAAVCCTVLGSVAAERGDGEQSARLLGHADGLRSEAGAPVPRFQCDDLDRAREMAFVQLGPEAFRAEFELGRLGRLGQEVTFIP